MSKYNLEQLGWFNFEKLIACLLREIVGNGLSTFNGSRDQGRDATFKGKASEYPSKTEEWAGYWIFQVKHRTYSTRGADTVRSELKKTLSLEIEKILKKHTFPCNNYIFITNCPLTAQNKDQMYEVIVNNYKQINHLSVLGESDVEGLLDNHPKVVSAFPQILGLSQLKDLINWGLQQRSLNFLHSAKADVALFVATSPYLKAIELLHKQNFCVLSGPPKMGKTFTAYALAAAFAAQSYEIYDLRTQRDFYAAFNSENKQLFICDDVFGDIALHANSRDEWTRGLLRLLGSLGKNHKLIWTAREYILKEAMSSSRLKEEHPIIITADNVTVAVDQISRIEKAVILYNHAKSEKLPEHIKKFLQRKACIKIVDHPCYSPESIRQLCTGRLLDLTDRSDGNEDSILELVNKFLSSPGEAWKTAYLSAPPGEKMLCIKKG